MKEVLIQPRNNNKIKNYNQNKKIEQIHKTNAYHWKYFGESINATTVQIPVLFYSENSAD